MDEESGAFVEAGDPVVDQRQFRRCLGQFATGVTIITARTGDQLVGVTANSFSSLSLEPPLILWSIGRSSRSFASFHSARFFAVNILASDQIGMSQRFSSSTVDKFGDGGWTEGRNGVPLIDGVAGRFECQVETTYEGGDHLIIIGRVARFARFEAEPLLFAKGRYGLVQEHPEFVENRALTSALPSVPKNDAQLLPLLFKAYHRMTAKFDEQRRADPVSLSQSHILALFTRSAFTMEGLLQATVLGRRDGEDAIADLTERKLVTRDAAGLLSLTPAGNELRLAINKRWNQFQAEQLQQFSKTEIESAGSVLMRMLA